MENFERRNKFPNVIQCFPKHNSGWKKPPLNHHANTVVHVSSSQKAVGAAIESGPSFSGQQCSGPTPRPEVSHYSPAPSHPPSPPGHITTPPTITPPRPCGGGGQGGYQSITADHSLRPQPCKASHHLLYLHSTFVFSFDL